MADEDSAPKRSKRKGFWTKQRAIIAIIFLAGFILGVIVTNQVVDPTLNASLFSDFNSLQEKNYSLDAQADLYYSCLQQLNIDPETCELPE
ncbi:MAG: hypothetical protein J4224_02490 [Candidatus Diapherotrites archaeon]|uniref:Uncharacterized protein n=1 Tax=Candidatus Iainarchaeum sp. TaxID=3101447 RepID=A0A7J4ISC0_9ARCH|nr:MAG: hypothetical protein QT03_C0001G0955 [archaeon GW2011_AR10]MBS3059271.1 hypothetical protein [Candidatus Diapherotrites archaeon]HIH08423.1 hypothetical protein [Candidatus Diapherotrites archaeon]